MRPPHETVIQKKLKLGSNFEDVFEHFGSFLDYLGAPQTVGNPIIGMVRNILNDIRLGDIVQIMDVENAPRIVYKNATIS